MAATTEILTTTEVISFAMSHSSMDEALLADFILPSQRMYLRDFLSKDYYNEMLTQVEGATLTADNSALLNDYLKPMLSYFILFDAFPFIRNNISSAGIMINTSETSQSASHQDYQSARNQCLSMGQRWKKDTEIFIADEQYTDSTKYPLFSDVKDDKSNKYGIIFY